MDKISISVSSGEYLHLQLALKSFAASADGPQYDWNIPEFEDLPCGETAAERGVSLRRGLSVKFDQADDERKRGIIDFYVRRFGGINQGDNGRFVHNDPEQIVEKFDRISSWSKALSLREPDNYLIYDSRVAKTLNWLQMRYIGRVVAFFPIPPRRLLTSAGGRRDRPNDERLRRARTDALMLRKQNAYHSYLTLMRDVEPDASARERLEMKLFAQADYDGWAT